MPPTIQTGGAKGTGESGSTSQSNNNPKLQRPTKPGVGAERRSDLICRVKYCNTLPDIPFDLKYVAYPFEPTRFIQFNPTSLERNYRYDVLTEHDLGVQIDLINKDIYAPPASQHGGEAILDPGDERLLEEDVATPQDSRRSRHHARSVSWLRRTEYISTEQTRFQPQSMDKVEAKVGYSIKKTLKTEGVLYMDRDTQIKAIESTFNEAQNVSIEKHYSKPNVHAVEVLPVFPDFDMWKYPCAQVIFDSDPAVLTTTAPSSGGSTSATTSIIQQLQIEEMSQAMIRGVMDESGEQFVAYFLPTPETMEKRRKQRQKQQQDNDNDNPNSDEDDDDDDVSFDYKMVRQYNWNVKSKATKGYEENYFLVLRDSAVYYNELETRVRLSKRRETLGRPVGNTRLVVQHRPIEANEFRVQRFREKQLEPAVDEEEEEDEDGEENNDDSEREKSRSGTPNSEENEETKNGGGDSEDGGDDSDGGRDSGRGRADDGANSDDSRSEVAVDSDDEGAKSDNE